MISTLCLKAAVRGLRLSHVVIRHKSAVQEFQNWVLNST